MREYGRTGVCEYGSTGESEEGSGGGSEEGSEGGSEGGRTLICSYLHLEEDLHRDHLLEVLNTDRDVLLIGLDGKAGYGFTRALDIAITLTLSPRP